MNDHLENVVLDELHEGAKTCSDLRRATGLSKFLVRRICQGLEEKGLVRGKVSGRTFVCEMVRTRKAA